MVERRRDELALRYGYDEDGRRAFIGYPDGSRTEYSYDAGGLLDGLRHPATGAIALERDPSGRIVGARGVGMHARWDYEGGELAGYSLGAGHTRLTRDDGGRIVSAVIDGTEQRFAYDAAGQLVAAGDRSFTYDAGGRLTRETSGAGAVDYVYDAAGQLTARGTTVFDLRRLRPPHPRAGRGPRPRLPLGRARPARRPSGTRRSTSTRSASSPRSTRPRCCGTRPTRSCRWRGWAIGR